MRQGLTPEFRPVANRDGVIKVCFYANEHRYHDELCLGDGECKFGSNPETETFKEGEKLQETTNINILHGLLMEDLSPCSFVVLNKLHICMICATQKSNTRVSTGHTSKYVCYRLFLRLQW